MRKLRVGVIGTGNMGKNHARVYSEIARLAAVSDVFEASAKEVAEKFGCNYYTDYKKMMEKENLDAVSVVVPTRLHKEVVIDTLSRKVPTLVEKPIASSLAEARLMIKKAKKEKTFLMVGHIERFNPVVIQLKKLIEEGKIGKVMSLLSIRVGISPPKEPNSDVALDLGIHDVDVFNYLLSDFPKKKRIIKTKLFTRNIADSATLLLEYETITGIIQTNWITPIKMRKLYISGTEGYAELDYINQRLVLYEKHLEIKLDESFYDIVSLSENLKKELYVSKKEPLKEELKFFLKNKDSRTLEMAENGILALKILI